MREILFRGKTTDNGEWVYGVPIKDQQGEMVIVESIFECEEYDCRGANCWYVDEKTVGQYTGLKDINGKKIFEGDYIGTRIWSEWDDTTVYLEGYVRFINGGFFIKSKTLSLDVFIMEERYEDPYFKIIGNIYDNPELLKECE